MARGPSDGFGPRPVLPGARPAAGGAAARPVDAQVLGARVARAVSTARATAIASERATLRGSLERQAALQLRNQAAAVRMDICRRRGHFYLSGAVAGRAVTAILCPRRLEVSPELRCQAELVVSLGERFPQQDGTELVASLDGPPLAVALTLIRACDRVDAVELGSAIRTAQEVDPSGELGAWGVFR